MRIQKPCSTSEVIAYSPGAIDSLWNSSQVTGSYSIAGVAKDGSFGWLARGGALEIFNVKFGQRLAAWCFGAATKDPETLITAVCEFENDRTATTQLIVASTTLNPRTPGGLICLFDVHRSAVIKAVQVPFEVTALETVAAVSPGATLSLLLCEQVHSFCGTVAAGTQCGHIYLLDMCTDEKNLSNELTPKQVEVFDCSHPDVVTLRYQAISKNKHLCLELGGSTEDGHLFTYCTSNGSVQRQLESSEIHISCLKFIKHTLTLLVGYSFGGFQLWNLRDPVLQYSSRWEEDLPAVTHFAFQEPENDPKNYCYIWVVHGPTSADPVKDTSSHMTLYQLCYQRKKWLEDFGFLYEGLYSLAIRFNQELHLDPYNPNSDPQCGSRVIACYTLENHQFKPNVKVNETLPDEEISPDRSLCLTVWEAVSLDERASSHCFLAIFDINRWYHAQLPSSISSYRNQKAFCPYWSVCALDEVVQNMCPDLLLMVHVDYNSLNRFVSPLIPLSEKFLYPSALAFNAYCISECGTVCSKFLGIQRLILGYIQKNGFSILLDPHEIYVACLKSGLLNTDSPVVKPSVTYQRESLLSMALDYNVVGFIVACIAQLANAEFVTEGFTMRSLLNWAWKKLSDCKESVDKLCVPLFDWSAAGLNEHDIRQLRYYQGLMRHLVTTFKTLNYHSSGTTEQGKEESATRLNIAQLIADYLDVIVLFHAVGLLPEHSEEEMVTGFQFAFPSSVLTANYVARRQTIQQLNSNASPSSVLIIDALMEADGVAISQLFERECGVQLYPPTSFHGMIGVFLLPDVAMQTKLTLVLYLLRDLTFLADFERAEKMEDICKQFCSSFNVPPSLYKHICGIWLLDHQQFQKASAVLLDAGVCDDIPPWQHGSIIRAFLCQGHERLALKYMKVKAVPALTADDVKLRMTVLLANGLTAEALDYQRIHRDANVMGDLMSHMILACLETNTIGELLNLPLTCEEENHLVRYLQNSGDAAGQKLVVLYYLQQSHFIDAISTNGRQKLGARPGERKKLLEAVVEGYRKVLPSVQRKMNFNTEIVHRIPSVHKEYARPTPLSCALHCHQAEQVVTRATLLNTVLNKVHELNIGDARSTDAQPGFAEEHQQRCEETSVLFGTPIVPSSVKKSRTSTFGDVIFPLSGIMDQTMNFTRLLDSPMSFTNHVTKRLYSASALSLLQTPPIRRHRTICTAAITQPPHPPQSILSVRHQKSKLETSVGPSSAATGVLTFDETIGSTPIIQSNLRRGIASHQAADMMATPKPKTLRFMEPQVSPLTAGAQQSTCLSQQGVETSPSPDTSPSDESAQSGGEGYADAAMDIQDEVVLNFKTPAVDYSIHCDDRDESVNQSSSQPSLQFVVKSSLSPEVSSVHYNNAAAKISEIKEDRMEVDEVVEVFSDDNLKGCLFSHSLHRPPLWESSQLPQSSGLRLSSISGLEEESATAESKISPICTDASAQTSLSKDSEDELVEECLPGEEKSAVARLSSTPTRRSSRLQLKKDDDPNDNSSTRSSVSEKTRVSPSATEQLRRTRESHEQSSHLAASTLGPDVSNDRSTRTRRRSVCSPGREFSKPSAEDSLQSEAKDVMVERPSTPTRRRSLRSPGREISEPAAEESAQSEMKDVVVEQPSTPTRRRSVLSPGREIREESAESVSDVTAVEQPSTPMRRRSVRSPSREVIGSSAEVSNQTADRDVIVDQPSMSTRRRSFRSPGREVLDPLVEEAVQNEIREFTVEEEGISSRRTSLRLASHREVIEPSGEDSAETETKQPSMSTRRRSFCSPSREVAEPTVQDSAKTEEACVMPTRRRSVRSPSREVIEPSVEESAQSENKKVMVDSTSVSTRRRSLRSSSREITDPARAKSEDVEKPSTRTRRRSLRSPSREVTEPLVEEKILPGNGESENIKTVGSGMPGQGSSVSPNRETVQTSVLDDSSPAKNSNQPLEEGQAATPTRRRFVRSPSRERVVLMDKLDESVTPVRRSQRQKEKLEKAEEKDLGGMSATQKSPQKNKGRQPSSDQGDNESETGKHQTPRISKTLVLSLQEKRKPVTRSETKRARERELLALGGQSAEVTVAVSVHSERRSPGRTAKRRAVEIETETETDTEMDVSVAGHVPPSVASVAVAQAVAATATESKEATEAPAGPQFAFAAPIFLDNKKDAPFALANPSSTYVFSPPHTRLRDRFAVEQQHVGPSATSSEYMELDEREDADEEKVGKPERRVKASKRGKRPRVAETPSSDDAPILLSPISDSEPSPKSSTTNVKKHIMKSSHVTRLKRKKFGSSDPPIYW